MLQILQKRITLSYLINFLFLYIYIYIRGVLGGGTPVHPQESEAGCNILNLHFYSDFFLFLSIDNVTICLFYMIIYKFIT